jgi:hypothetical protein
VSADAVVYLDDIELPEDLVTAANDMWPNATWSQVIARGLWLALQEARADEAAELEPGRSAGDVR